MSPTKDSGNAKRTRAAKRVVLVACGSFNPITNMHLRLFELARDALIKARPGVRTVGVVSPVSDGYYKKGLAPAKDRVEMVRLALASSDWIRLDSWEAEQPGWLETVHVLRRFKEIGPSYFRWGPGSARTPGNHQVENIDKLNGNVIAKNSWCCNGNGGYWGEWMKGQEEEEEGEEGGEVEVKLLCGADLLQSFESPGVWKTEHVEEILGDFGVVVCSRDGCRPDDLVRGSDLLGRHSDNIVRVTERITNDISSTKIREAVARGESIKYLVQDPVINYIREKRLYRGGGESK